METFGNVQVQVKANLLPSLARLGATAISGNRVITTYEKSTNDQHFALDQLGELAHLALE
jgi:hypothetical protein